MAELNATELATFYADYINAWNRRDLESYYLLYRADVVFRDGSAMLHGIDALRNRYEAELREYRDLMLECVRLFVDIESQAIAAENVERDTGIELRGALFLTLDPEGRISEIARVLGRRKCRALGGALSKPLISNPQNHLQRLLDLTDSVGVRLSKLPKQAPASDSPDTAADGDTGSLDAFFGRNLRAEWRSGA
jgi:hypothetical protein